MKRGIILLLVAGLLVQSCERKPTACLDVPEQLEAGKDLTLHSCSEHYEFLAWDFGDGSSGFIGEAPVHHFDEEGDYELTLTAYSDGAYRSDEVKQMVHTSYRFLHSFQVIGTSEFASFQFKLGNRKWTRGGAAGTFTEADPYEAIIWPADTFRILPERQSVELYGVKNNLNTALIQANVNFKLADENPIIVQSGPYTLKVFWTFK